MDKKKRFTTGKIVDHIARKILSKYNYDYNHSTGHGVGYLSNVHETPPALSKFDNKIIIKFFTKKLLFIMH